ncbi:MAG: PHP domain-containing protein [Desulfobia sp.]
MSENRIIDLHVHTSFSDGTDTPSATVLKASNCGLAAIAITDHDTVAGVKEGVEQGIKSGVEVIPGVELSAVTGGKSIHILGYGLDVETSGLLKSLGEIQAARNKRNQDIIDKLKNMGIEVSMDELRIYSGEGQTGRPHFARLLHQKNITRNPEEAFRHYLGKEGSAYVPRKILSAGEAISIIQRAGGLAVLAHPLTIDTDRDGLTQLIDELKNFGLAGLEVYYPTHNRETQDRLIKLCRKFHLIITGGSDFHGKNKPNIRMGRVSRNQTIPYKILSNLQWELRSRSIS